MLFATPICGFCLDTFMLYYECKAKPNKANPNLISPQDLNQFLSGTVYLVGSQLTLADIMLYYALHPVMMELSIQEKEQLVNLSRWFNQVNLTIARIFLQSNQVKRTPQDYILFK